MQNKPLLVLIVSLIFLLIDWYVFQAVKTASRDLSEPVRKFISGAYWGITIINILLFATYNLTNIYKASGSTRFPAFVLLFIFANYISKILVIVFLLLDDLIRLVKWVISLFAPAVKSTEVLVNASENTIPRSEFLAKTALAVGTVPLVGMAYGVIVGAHDYRIRRINLKIPNLPNAFKGMQVGQISDIHSGSFFNKVAVTGGIDMLMNEKPELIFFTGDLVNNFAKEMYDYQDIFSKIKAPLGVFSILGNHDYGDYAWWPSKEAQRKNLQDLIATHKLMGWDLLLDEHRLIAVDNQEIGLVGIQNWGKGRFPKYGKMDKALAGMPDVPVKLLLSHDPSHWDLQVTEKYKDIDVTFSGHTHGMQFGVEIGNFQWSPVKYQYKHWGGLYADGAQQLYVNRGFGYIGYPGRIGMPPELTIFTLDKA